MALPCPHRRRVLLGGAGLVLAGCAPGAAQAADLSVYKDPNCGCCRGWVDHMTRAGFTAKVVETAALDSIRARYKVPDSLASCHTALVGGYVVEGHVPPEDVRRLLHERPDAGRPGRAGHAARIARHGNAGWRASALSGDAVRAQGRLGVRRARLSTGGADRPQARSRPAIPAATSVQRPSRQDPL